MKAKKKPFSSLLLLQQCLGYLWLFFLLSMPLPSLGAGNEGMVLVKGGCFTMGNNDGLKDEKPAHKVCLKDFYLDALEVTQGHFETVTGSNPSKFKGNGSRPVDSATWFEAKGYCEKTGKRLPTEAEWEYAAREGGKKMMFPGFKSEAELNDYAWTDFNSIDKETSAVGIKKPNGLGLYDMAGNVSEWVSDWYDEGYYAASPKDNPGGPPTGTYKVLRGGSWCDNNKHVFSVYGRLGRAPDFKDSEYGFRCAKTP